MVEQVPDVTLMYLAWTTEIDIAAFLSISFLDSQCETNRSYLSIAFSFLFWLLLAPIVWWTWTLSFPYLCTAIDALSARECVRIKQSSKGYTIVMAMHLVAYPICLVYIAIPRLDSMF